MSYIETARVDHDTAEAYAVAAYENYIAGKMTSAAVEAVMDWFSLAFGYGPSEVLLIAAQGASERGHR